MADAEKSLGAQPPTADNLLPKSEPEPPLSDTEDKPEKEKEKEKEKGAGFKDYFVSRRRK